MQISVVVCTRDRASQLAGSITSIHRAADAVPDASVQLVVVDNGSTDGTGAELDRLSRLLGRPIDVVHEARAGLSRARNAGLAAATGALIVFTDDDCHMNPDYLDRALIADAQDQDRLTLRGGRVLLGDPRDLPFTIKLDEHSASWSRERNDASRYNLGNSLLGANLCFRKAVTEKVGLFDVRLGAGSSIPGGEDTDYIFRCYEAGLEIAYDHTLVVHHFHGKRERHQARLLAKNYSIGGGALVAKYLFRSPGLVKQFRWDMKNAAKEVMGRTNTFYPEIGFSHWDKVRWHFVGLWRFSWQALRGRPAQ